MERKGVGTGPDPIIALLMVLFPFFLGGARPWFWTFLACIFFVGAAVLIWTRRSPFFQGKETRPKWTCVVLGLLIATPFLQTLPIAPSWIDVLSPQRALWCGIANRVTQLTDVAVSISYTPLTTLYSGFFWLFLGGFALYLHRVLSQERNHSWFFQLLLIIAGAEAFYGLLQALIPTLGVLWEAEGAGVARGTYVNRNHFAAFLGMIWPILLGYSIGLGRQFAGSRAVDFNEQERLKEIRQKQFLLGFIISLILLAVLFSLSRGGIIGTLVALTVLGILGGTHQKGLLASVIMSWAVTLVYGAVIGFDQIIARFDLMENDAPGRFVIWQDAWRIVQEHILTGTGLGSFPSVICLYQTHLLDETAHVVHAHNDYLELACDLGLPVAGGIILLIWGYWWRTAWKVYKMRPQSRGGRRQSLKKGGKTDGGRGRSFPGGSWYDEGADRSLLAAGALAGSASLLSHAWVEFNWQIPANQLYFVMLLTLMHVWSKAPKGSRDDGQ